MGGYTLIDLGILIKDTLVIADLHLGYEEALGRNGVVMPRFHLSDLLARLEGMIISCNPKTIIINGDIKHDFGGASEQEWRDLGLLFRFLKRHAEIELIRGNHDRMLDGIAKKNGLAIHDSIVRDGFMIMHGDSIPPSLPPYESMVIGHEHPAVSLREGARTERFKCFLETTWQGKRLLVLPSCNLVTEGHDLMREAPISPFLKENMEESRVYLIAEPGKILDFGFYRRMKANY